MVNLLDIKPGSKLIEEGNDYYIYHVVSINNDCLNIGYNTYVTTVSVKVLSKHNRFVGKGTIHFDYETKLNHSYKIK